MKRMSVLGAVCAVLICCSAPKAEALILINEFLADPPLGLAGDANGDGVRSTSDDEFVELYYSGKSVLDISGWTLADAAAVRHVFAPQTLVQPDSLFVVFGGGSPAINDAPWWTASTGALSLNNAGDTISFWDLNGALIDQAVYGSDGGRDQSLVRLPEGEGSEFVPHLELPGADGLRYSPGYFIDGPETGEVQPESANTVPEPASLYLVGMGLAGGLLKRGVTPKLKKPKFRFSSF